jgi:putative transposase
MGRYPRYLPRSERDRTLVEITCRVTQGRALLHPSTKANRRIVGVIGRAQRMYDVGIHGTGFLSSHYHSLCSFEDLEQQRSFMTLVQGNLSREVGRLHDWSGPLWGRRYSAIPVSDEELAQLARLRYLLEQGCKEGLVESPLEWPGASSAWHLWQGLTMMEGEWVDRTDLFRRRRSNPRLTEEDCTVLESIELTPLPCWEHLPKEEYRARVREMIEDIARETRDRHRVAGTRPLGAEKIRRRHPHSRPTHLDCSPAPKYHCASKEARERFWAALREFVDAFRSAAEKLKGGDLVVAFPEGSFPPPRQFVPVPRARAPGTA